MDDDRVYRPGGTAGGWCGCAAAVLPLLTLGPVWLLIHSLGHCDPCFRDQSWDFPIMVATLGSLGALLGFGVRALVNWLVRRVRDPADAGWPPLWAIAGLLAVAAALDWLIDYGI